MRNRAHFVNCTSSSHHWVLMPEGLSTKIELTQPARWFTRCFKNAFSLWCGAARSTVGLCGLISSDALKYWKIEWNIIMKLSDAGHFPVCSQTDSLPFSGSALYSQGEPQRGRRRNLECGGWKEWGGFGYSILFDVSGSNFFSVSSSQTVPHFVGPAPHRQAYLDSAVSWMPQPLGSGNTTSCLLLIFIIKTTTTSSSNYTHCMAIIKKNGNEIKL